MPLLQLSQLSLAYGHVPLLDHVDLVVEPGERIGLIGRNGTGKSTLFLDNVVTQTIAKRCSLDALAANPMSSCSPLHSMLPRPPC